MSSLIIRNAQVVTEAGIVRAEIRVDDGVITEVATTISGVAALDIDILGAFVFPGFIDAHVHFNEPGRADWEGLTTGPQALAAGGGTVFLDMPLNSDPPVLTAEALNTKRSLAEEKSLLDFALWGGLCPGHTDHIDAMAEVGAVGFKAFLGPGDLPEFPSADAKTLRAGMRRAHAHSLPVAVQAGDPRLLGEAAPQADTSMATFLASQPKEAEVHAIRRACELAGETGAMLHVVQVSCAEGLAEIRSARNAGADVSAETCPHYLLFHSAEAEQMGARAKCTPPLRSENEVEALWNALLSGQVDSISSDHSPAPPDKKTGDDFFNIRGGIAGCQHAFPSFLAALRRRAPEQLFRAAGWLAAHPAHRFALSGKTGRIAVGNSADLVVVDFRKSSPITRDGLLYRHPVSLYEGQPAGCQITDVLRRGEFIVQRGEVQTEVSGGIFIRPPSA